MKHAFVILIALCLTSNTYAQRGEGRSDEKSDQIEAAKVAFITQELDLTVEEAQRFWPIYNEHTSVMEALKPNRPTKNLDVLSDQEAADMLDQILEDENKRHRLKEEYILNLQNVLPPRKLLKLYHLDKEFKRKMLRKFKSKHEKRRGKRMDKTDRQ